LRREGPDPVGVVREPVTDGIGERRVADVVVVLGGGSWLVMIVDREP